MGGCVSGRVMGKYQIVKGGWVCKCSQASDITITLIQVGRVAVTSAPGRVSDLAPSLLQVPQTTPQNVAQGNTIRVTQAPG